VRIATAAAAPPGNLEDGDVKLSAGEGEGIVTLTFANSSPVPVPVEQANGQWRLSDAFGILVGTGG
jgi:hypothetical protein